MDTVTSDVRSAMMAAVPRINSMPEITVRAAIHAMGYRFRLHSRDLPGRPDIVLPRHRKVVFVHGCFWHRHGCRKTTTPSTNNDFWTQKFASNRERDKRVVKKLRFLGWKSLVIWECQLDKPDRMLRRLRSFLES
jgi:DNA mismatch endonuclease, patch repair protein